MTDINWPDSLGKPLIAGYTYTLGSSENVRSVNGPSRSRTTSAKHEIIFSVNYLWSDEQLRRFQQFCNDDTDYMQKWFVQALLLGAELLPVKVRLFDISPFQREGNKWRAAMTLQCLDIHALPDDIVELLLLWDLEGLERSGQRSQESLCYLSGLFDDLDN